MIAYDNMVVSGSQDQTIKIWNPFETKHSAKLIRTINTRYPISALARLPNTTFLVSGSKSSTKIQIWDMSDLKKQELLVNSFDAPVWAGGVVSLAIFQDGCLATGHINGDILLWNPLKQKDPFLYALPKKHTRAVNAMLVLANNSLVSGSMDTTINWWTADVARKIFNLLSITKRPLS